MILNNSSSLSEKIMLIFRFLLGLLLFYLSLQQIFVQDFFRKTLELPAQQGLYLKWFFQFFLSSPTIFTLSWVLVVLVEILLGIALLIGFLPRLASFLVTVFLLIIIIGLIPNWFILFIHSVPLLFSIPLILYGSDQYSPFSKYLPQRIKFLQTTNDIP